MNGRLQIVMRHNVVTFTERLQISWMMNFKMPSMLSRER